jgi:hypothetical protein
MSGTPRTKHQRLKLRLARVTAICNFTTEAQDRIREPLNIYWSTDWENFGEVPVLHAPRRQGRREPAFGGNLTDLLQRVDEDPATYVARRRKRKAPR